MSHGGWRAMFGSHSKALALYRISLGIMLLIELLLRYRFLHAFYSDEGTLPMSLLWPKVDSIYKMISIHCWSGNLLYQQFLLSLQVFCSIGLILGYKSKYTSVLSWFLYLSSTLRNTWLSFILDRYFHYLLFYSMFLPLDRHWSLMPTATKYNNSNKINKEEQRKQWVTTFATAALKLQVFWIYLDAGSGKYMDPLQGWTLNANPLPALDTYTRHTVVARILYGLLQPEGLRLLTPTVVYVELLCAPVALLGSYIGNKALVYTAIVSIVALHIGIALALRNTVLLSSVACVAWCVFLPLGDDDTDNSGKNVGRKENDEKMTSDPANQENDKTNCGGHEKISLFSKLLILSFVSGSLWLESISNECDQSTKHIWSTLLHNRWNVFVGAEEYVTWEIAPGRLADGSIVDVWARTDTVSWDMPGTGTPCTSTARPGRWRSFPYLAGLEGPDGEALWGYLCKEWDAEHDVAHHPEKKLLRYNFFMLQADVFPNMGFSATRKRLVKSCVCPNHTNIATDAAESPAAGEKETKGSNPALGTEQDDPETSGKHGEASQTQNEEDEKKKDGSRSSSSEL